MAFGALAFGEGEIWKLHEGSIAFEPEKGKAHRDRIEMSGLKASAIVDYGADAAGELELSVRAVFPSFRMKPNLMESAFIRDFAIDPLKLANTGRFGAVRDTPNRVRAKVKRITFDGVLRIEERFDGESRLEISREIAPSPDKAAICQAIEVKNVGDSAANVEIPEICIVARPNEGLCDSGRYKAVCKTSGHGGFRLEPNGTLRFQMTICASPDGEDPEADARAEIAKRRVFLSGLGESLTLKTPDPAIDRMFAFAKIRAAESVFETRAGLMHCPGGGRYYMGFWANDQAEYASPLFPFLGDKNALEAAFNMFALWSRHMSPDYKMIPSAITAEGKITWNGKGDRGDAAMIAYGAGRLALACGDAARAGELEPLIDWCLEYCRRNLDERGVVRSDCDELELRFPAGDANLCTSSLYYDALVSASHLKRELGDAKAARELSARAAEMRKNIKRHFEAEVEGFKTYRYYEGNDVLRSWIAIPLCMGILDRADGTAEALLSPRLLTKDGMLVQSSTRNNYWDRTYLYALRGLFAAGKADGAARALAEYAAKRLLGGHVPYAIEAFPEGDKRHLSAESALFCRIASEGIFGIRPTGFRSFEIRPGLPGGWAGAKLSRIRAFGDDFDVELSRANGGTRVRVASRKTGKTAEKTVAPGGAVQIKL